MKCFNHPDREAVATCQKCGKGLCRECAGKHSPCLCDDCAAQIQRDKQAQARNKEEEKKQKYKDALVDTRSEFVKTVAYGIIIGLIWIWLLSSPSDTFADKAGSFVLAFFIPFGWKVLTYLQSFIPLALFGTWWFWIIYACVKACLSIFVGIPAFIYQLIRTIRNEKKIKDLG